MGIAFFHAHNVVVCGARWMQKHSLWNWCGTGRPSTGLPTSTHPWMARECVCRNACITCALRLCLHAVFLDSMNSPGRLGMLSNMMAGCLETHLIAQSPS